MASFQPKHPFGTLDNAREKAQAFSRRKYASAYFVVRHEPGSEDAKWWGEFNCITEAELEDYQADDVLMRYDGGRITWSKLPGSRKPAPAN